MTYLVLTDDRQVWKRHLDQLKEFQERRETTEFTSENTEFPFIPPQESEPEEREEPDNVELESNTENDTTSPRYPSRTRQPPDRLM